MTAAPDNDAQVYKARSVRRVDPVSAGIAEALKGVAPLRYIKLLPGRLAASNVALHRRSQEPGGDGRGRGHRRCGASDRRRVHGSSSSTPSLPPSRVAGARWWPPSWRRHPRTGSWSWLWIGAADSGSAWPRSTRAWSSSERFAAIRLAPRDQCVVSESEGLIEGRNQLWVDAELDAPSDAGNAPNEAALLQADQHGVNGGRREPEEAL